MQLIDMPVSWSLAESHYASLIIRMPLIGAFYAAQALCRENAFLRHWTHGHINVLLTSDAGDLMTLDACRA